MQYISIKGCSKPISRLIKGTDYLLLNEFEQISDHLDDYMELGGNMIDTAHIYTDGESEQVIGKYIQSRNNRETLVLMSKGGMPDTDGNSRLGHAALSEQIKCSLDRLQTSYLDMYALHRDDTELHVGQILETMNEHMVAGHIHAFGSSNWTTSRIAEANEYATKHGLVGFAFNSPNLSLARPQEPFWGGVLEADDEMRQWHHETKLPLLSWSPLARGFFTGKYTPEVRSDEDMVRVFYNEDNWAKYERASQLATSKGVSTIEIALAFVLNQSYPTCAIIGARSKTELDSCLVGSTIQLTPSEVEWLNLAE
ncbi:aldo/keto reductase [Paenibacillus endoradicis]|uniref:aldo/keto reductase n=1 Tax=Paenibacillus endoradicis TaxID=2972487 RepID=UPI002158F388|nr:aldo/keto reductase [Paenibacillus endoradicis]MCR8659059.1 aldo/keto reductase [Paenibacillus endoradicis]